MRKLFLILLLTFAMLLPVSAEAVWYIDEMNSEITDTVINADILPSDTIDLETLDLDTLDLNIPTGYTVEQLDMVLKHKLKGLGEYFVKAEEEYGINSVFLASVAALESGWGRNCFRQNNMFGWGRKTFDSKAECIDFVARKLKENYLSEDGVYHVGTTVDAVNYFYNGREKWARAVKNIMYNLFEDLELNHNN